MQLQCLTRPSCSPDHLQVLRARHGAGPLLQAAQYDAPCRKVDPRSQGGGGGQHLQQRFNYYLDIVL